MTFSVYFYLKLTEDDKNQVAHLSDLIWSSEYIIYIDE